MLMADTMAVFFVVLGIMMSFVGLWLLSSGLWPVRVSAATERLERGLVVPFVVGLPIAFVTLVAASIVSALPGKLGTIAAILVVCAFTVFAHAGVSGLATCIGRRLESAVDEASPWRATLRGSIVLVLAYLAPVVGWFVILPITTIAGAGATTIALVDRRRSASRNAAAGAEAFAPHTADVANV